ncbi:hypothetical protein TNCV_5000551 [Trichonephila clavipes]|nr:hypothetical protein TNCV_5000551 [Trichonephila clavipes]
MSVFALELKLSSSHQIWKWEIVNRHDPYQDNGTKLFYCHQSLTSVQNFELIRPFRVGKNIVQRFRYIQSWLEIYANLQSPKTPKSISDKVPYRSVTNPSKKKTRFIRRSKMA